MKKHTRSFFLPVIIFALITAALTVASNLQKQGGVFKNMGLGIQQRTTSDIALTTNNVMEVDSEEIAIAGGNGSSMKAAMIAPDYYPMPSDDALWVEDRVYNKNSSHSVVSRDVSQYIRNLKEYLLSIDGRVLSSSVNTSSKYHTAYIYAKVPANKFDEVTNRITEDAKKVVNESINISDVTGQYVSSEDNLDNLKKQKLEKEIELENAKTDAEKRRIQYDIERLEQQIDQAEKRMDRVEQGVEYASVNVTVSNNERYFKPTVYREGIWGQFGLAWQSVLAVLYFLAIVAIWIVVYSIIWLPIVLIARLIKKLIKKNQ